jgi:hypothetical protein
MAKVNFFIRIKIEKEQKKREEKFNKIVFANSRAQGGPPVGATPPC